MVYFLRMNIKAVPRQVQKQTLAPSLQQSVEILLLPLAELRETIEQELQDNPLLEVTEDKTPTDSNPMEELILKNINRLTDPKQTQNYQSGENDYDPGDSSIESILSLEDSLFQQLRFEVTDPLKLKIGEMIIGNLDEDGYFHSTCEEIAESLGLKDTQVVEEVLSTIQVFEPIGIASRSLKECLLIQVNYYSNGNKDLLRALIENHLEELGRKNITAISRQLKIPEDTVRELAHQVSALEPKPARRYRPMNDNLYIRPDIIVKKNDVGDYDIKMNRDTIPSLRISKLYQKILQEPNRSEEEVNFIKEKIRKGLFFIKSIEQRYHTLEEIAKYILNHQKAFFFEGQTTIEPMILKDVAQAINRNESTISRAISNKFMDTSLGFFPLKFFFSQAISHNGQGSVSTRTVKEELKTLIDEEDKTHPLSDHEIQSLFQEKGVQLARRTISKYRKVLKILPSHLRKSQ